MPKVIYTSILNKNISYVIKILEKKYDWHPEVLISAGRFKDMTKSNFSKSLNIDQSDLRRANFDYTKLKKKFPIDDHLIKKLSFYESNFLNWIEDTNGRNFSFSERRRYYYDLLMYWNTVINNHKPEIFISFSWPHTVSDYALYLICKHVYSIPVIFLDVIPFFNTKHRLLFLSYDNMSATIDKAYLNSEDMKIDPVVENYIKKLRKKEEPFVHSNILEFFENNKISSKQILLDIFKTTKLLLSFQITKKPDIFFKKNNKPIGKNSQMNHFEYFIFKYKVMIKNLLLKNFYKSISKPVNYKENYIYYPGPYIPEAMSNIVPGKFEDPFIILDMLSAILPTGWKVYYKEHPATFAAGSKGSLGKDRYFFEKLKKYEFVKIVPHDESTFKLTDFSKAVMTAGGTAGWEAVVREKPCLLFGSLWYQDCPEVFKIESMDDLNISLDKIVKGFRPNLNNVKKFMQSLYSSLLQNGELLNSKTATIKNEGELDIELTNIARDLNIVYKKFFKKQ